MSVVVGIDLSNKEPRRQMGVDMVVISGSLGDVMINTVARIGRDVGLIPALGAIFPIMITLTAVLTDSCIVPRCFRLVSLSVSRACHQASSLTYLLPVNCIFVIIFVTLSVSINDDTSGEVNIVLFISNVFILILQQTKILIPHFSLLHNT